MKTNINEGIKMIKIKEFKLYGNWTEVTWVEESTQTSEEGVETTTEVQVHCESFSDHPEHIELLRKRAETFGTSLDDYESQISEIIKNRYVPTPEEVAEAEELANTERIKMIKAVAAEKINAEYPIYKQMNILRDGSDEDKEIMNARINYIRDVSNIAESTGTKVEDIKWEL